jgi:hypothetical protein
VLERHDEPTRAPRPRARPRPGGVRVYAAVTTAALIGAAALLMLRLLLVETVKVQIESEPPGAQFVIGGNPPAEGRTPSRVELPKSSNKRRLVLTLPGYEPAERSITLENDHTEAIVLQPQPRP